MRLAAIYNVWSDWDLLELSIKNIRPLVDGVIIVFSRTSNFGEENIEPIDWTLKFPVDDLITMVLAEPDLNRSQQDSERAKRNCGLEYAKKWGYTHFLMMDADEFYEPEPFLKEKERFKNPNLNGLVCGLKCYFKKPTLTVPDKTLVPFIHKITPELKFEWNINYPFAFEGVKREIRIDPTRQLNITSGVEWSNITMHHYSWVRKDIKKKIRNSTARQNIENSTIVRDYVNAKPGYYCEYYRETLQECENLFNIPDIIDENLTSI